MVLSEDVVVYSDKWTMLEETMMELADSYPDKESFYADLITRMETLDSRLPEVRQAGFANSTLQIIIISGMILVVWAIICGPLFKEVFMNKTKLSG